MRVQRKIRTGGGLHAFTISTSHTLSWGALKSLDNRCDWNNGTPGGAARAAVASVVWSGCIYV